MKLLPIKSVSFGYNSEYHKFVKDELSKAKQNKELARFLIEADKLSLQLEDEIILMEHDSKKWQASRFKDVTNYLNDLKQVIAFYMTSAFPKLKYADSLIKQYFAEFNSTTNASFQDWRKKIIYSMHGFTMGEYPEITSIFEKPKTLNKNENNDVKKMASDIIEQAVDNFVEAQANDVLEQFVPNATSPKGFMDVVGMEDVKIKLSEDIVALAKSPEQAKKDFEEYGITAPRGFLFYGPPGCGKTYITQALAAESGLDMYKLDVSKAGSKYVNQTSVNLKKAFDFLKHKAKKDDKPILLFMDEVDSFALSRGEFSQSDENMKTVSTILKLVEGAKDDNIIVIAATNKYDLLDEAFKARFDGQIYFPLPDEKQIKLLLTTLLSSRKKGINLSRNTDKIEELSKMLKGYSNRSITFIVDEASKLARRNNREDISFNDVKIAIESSELEKSQEKKYQKASKNIRPIGFR